MANTPTPPVQANGAPPPPPAATEPPKEDGKALRAKLAEVAEKEKQKHAARQQERARLEAAERDRQSANARAEAAEARAKELEASLAADPIGFAKKYGISARDLGERIVKEGSTEEQLQQAIALAKEADRKNEELRKELFGREQRANAERAQLQARRALIDTVESRKASMPILTRLAPDEMIDEYMRTYNMALAHPDTGPIVRQGGFTDAELLEATEARLLSKLRERLEFDVLDVEELEKHLTRRRGSASLTDKAETASGTQATKAVSTSRTGKTLSSALQQGSSGSWKPDNWDKLSDKKQNEILIARIKSGQPID